MKAEAAEMINMMLKKQLNNEFYKIIDEDIKKLHCKCDGIYSEYIKCIDDGFAQIINAIPSIDEQSDNFTDYNEIRSKILEFLGNEKNGILTSMDSTSKSRFVHLEKFIDKLVSAKSENIMKKLIQELSFSTMATETQILTLTLTTPDGQTLSLST